MNELVEFLLAALIGIGVGSLLRVTKDDDGHRHLEFNTTVPVGLPILYIVVFTLLLTWSVRN